MANGYFERGEIYWVRMDNGFGGEQGVGRPGVVVSADEINNKYTTVSLAFMSKQPHPNLHYVAVEATGITSYVVCNQIVTYDKTRLGKHIGTLNREEQKLVDDALEEVFDLGYVDDGALREKDEEIAARNAVIAEKDREIETLKAQIEAVEQSRESDALSYRIESEMFQKLYEKVLTQLVDMKFTNDLFLRRDVPVIKAAEPPKQPEEPDTPEETPDDRVDINHCTITALKKLGFSPSMANRIVERRPFKEVLDLKRVPGLTATQYRIMEPKLRCTVEQEPKREIVSALPEPDSGCEEPETAMLNINAASYREIHEATGVNISVCHSIAGYRKKNGPYEKLEDLLNVRDVYPGTLEKIRGKVEFGEVPAAPVAVAEKVNVNTTNARQITSLTGLNQKTAQAVVRYRKENGPFANLDELLNVPEFGASCMAKYRDKLEV